MRISGVFFIEAQENDTVSGLVYSARILCGTKDEDIGIAVDDGRVIIPSDYFNNLTDENLRPLVSKGLVQSAASKGAIVNISKMQL